MPGVKGLFRNSKTAAPLLMPTSEDVAWSAGFLEGEGDFTNASVNRGYISFRVRASQKNPEPLRRLLTFWGGRLFERKNGRWGMIWEWDACGERARTVSAAVFSRLSEIRQAQILAASTRRRVS